MKKIILSCILYVSCVSIAGAQIQSYNGGSLFCNGFARVTSNTHSFYIDTTGKYAFDRYDENDTYFDELSQPGRKKVIKGNKCGVVSDNGQWILRAIYDKIEKYDSTYYLVQKDGKADLYKSEGSCFLFDFLYQDLTPLKGEYFTVKQNGKWGVFSKTAKHLITPAIYDEFDYCFCCDSLGDYVYARKGNKWGIVSFNNEVLLPFKYEYTHAERRSDEWVTAFMRNDKRLVVNIYTKKETICPEECDCEKDFDWGFKRVKSGSKYGLVNTQEKLVLDTVYNYISRFAGYGEDTVNPYILIRQDNLYGVADSTGKIIIAPVYSDWPRIYNNHLFQLEKDELLGIANESGKIIMPFKLKYIDGIYGDSLVLGSETENAGTMLYRLDGTPLLKDTFQSINKVPSDSTMPEFASLFSIQQNNKEGFYNAGTGAFIAPQYDWSNSGTYYYNGKRLMEVRKDTVVGLIDENGVVMMPVEYTYLNNPLKGYDYLVSAGKGDKDILFNITTKKEVLSVDGSISQLEADSSLFLVRERTDDYMRTRDKIVSATGEEIISAQREIVNIGKDFAVQLPADSMNTFSLINYKMRSVTPLPYTKVWTCNNSSLIVVAKDTTATQLFNVQTGKLLPENFDFTIEKEQGVIKEIPGVWGFMNNYSIVTQKGKQGIIDSNGTFIIPGVYDNIEYLNDHILLIQKTETSVSGGLIFKKTQYGFADISGRIILPVQYDMPSTKTSFDLFKSGYFMLVKRMPGKENHYNFLNEKWGIADTAGNIIIEPKYDNIILDESGNGFIVQQDNKWGILNKQGKERVPCKYDDVVYMINGYYRENLLKSSLAMVKKGETYRYVNESGKELPVVVKRIITYYLSFDEYLSVPSAHPAGNKKSNIKSSHQKYRYQ